MRLPPQPGRQLAGDPQDGAAAASQVWRWLVGSVAYVVVQPVGGRRWGCGRCRRWACGALEDLVPFAVARRPDRRYGAVAGRMLMLAAARCCPANANLSTTALKVVIDYAAHSWLAMARKTDVGSYFFWSQAQYGADPHEWEALRRAVYSSAFLSLWEAVTVAQ